MTDPKEGITRSIQYALKELGGTAPDAADLTWCIGPPLLASLEQLLDDKGQASEAIIKYRERFGEVGIFENEIYPDIPDTLSTLKDAGYRMFVATSKVTVYAERIIDHFHLREFFDGVYGSEFDGRRADKSELLSYLLKTEKLKPEQTAMVGDRKFDMIGAVNNRLKPIGVLYGYGDRAELMEAGAETLCDTPKDLLRVFSGPGEIAAAPRPTMAEPLDSRR